MEKNDTPTMHDAPQPAKPKRAKTGGRQKGTPNKVTANAREWLGKLIDENRAQIKRDLKALEPKERLLVLEKFMSYAIPKLQAVSASVDIDTLNDAQLEEVINGISKNILER